MTAWNRQADTLKQTKQANKSLACKIKAMFILTNIKTGCRMCLPVFGVSYSYQSPSKLLACLAKWLLYLQ